MFNPSNEAMLKPAYPGGNEYFINLNGHAFYYIMEFYRTGEITWNEDLPATKDLDFCDIPVKDSIKVKRSPCYSKIIIGVLDFYLLNK
jgi:hypothetical protein